ncbi:MAG: DnaJ domain-containing protein [Hyphomicrobiales bacterium]|nr:DnaJ domain-containing protein [Hyphomicrobiales bacterium]MBV9052329.1 DnaJ domain-containing protein [Hyphomicrobiales bacterium]MBV9137297.1 DnaJ domain-containing protein [Hyphomicrobiales bacterium]MBV9975954.1 DnaJ domain-containing protein [Hyphomicrobiales bacterium]
MIFLILVLATLIVIWSAGRGLIQIRPGSLTRLTRVAAIAACLAIAVLFALRGHFEISLVALGAIWLMEGSLNLPRLRFGSRRPAGSGAGAVSTFRTAMIEMRVDHGTGAMRGTVLAGAFAGRELELLTETQLGMLALECAKFDAEGARLLEAYLDRRFAGRRENAYAHADSGPPRRRSGAMTAEEAYEVLGLAPGAPDDAVRRAYRDLMKKLHPDQGGSTYLAARVNQARDVLLNRHR